MELLPYQKDFLKLLEAKNKRLGIIGGRRIGMTAIARQSGQTFIGVDMAKAPGLDRVVFWRYDEAGQIVIAEAPPRELKK